MSFKFPKVIIITGHYGCGKTNIAVNFALDLANRGEKVTVVDLDIVNPYFRTADFKDLFDKHNITLKAPVYANSNLDIPALNYDLGSIIDEGQYVIIDVGGDDAGATALGRYRPVLENRGDVKMYCVINKYRYLTATAEETTALMREIEEAAELRCSGIINNPNLGNLTDKKTVETSLPYARAVAEKTGLPLIMTAAKAEFLESIPDGYPVEIYVKPSWAE